MPRIRCFGPLLLAVSLTAAAQTAPATRPQPGATVDPGITDPTAVTASAPPAFVPGEINEQAHPSRQAPVRISGGVMAGYLLHHVMPAYPPEAVAAHVSSVVVLAVVISKNGSVKDVTRISGAPVMAGPAIDAVRRWTYRPYLLNGQPTEVSTTVTCSAQFNAGYNAAPK